MSAALEKGREGINSFRPPFTNYNDVKSTRSNYFNIDGENNKFFITINIIFSPKKRVGGPSGSPAKRGRGA